MAPATTRSTRSKDKASKLTDDGGVGKRAAKPKPNDRKAVLQSEIKRLEEEIESGTGNAQELQMQLDMRQAEYEPFMDVDSPDNESQANPPGGQIGGTDNGGVPSDSNPAPGSNLPPQPNPGKSPQTATARDSNPAPGSTPLPHPNQAQSSQTATRQNQDSDPFLAEFVQEVTDQLSRTDISRDPEKKPVAWRGGLRGKRFTMRYGSLGKCKYGTVSNERYDTTNLQHVSEPLNFRNSKLKKVYDAHNIAGFKGIVVYGKNNNCDVRVCWQRLTEGVPDSLRMENGCSWVTRTELQQCFLKAGWSKNRLWEKMKETWENQENDYAEQTSFYTAQPFPILQPLPSTKQGSGASHRGRRESPAADSGHVIDATGAGSAQDKASESPALAGSSRTRPSAAAPLFVPQEEQRSSDSFFLQAGPQTTTPKSENITFNKTQYVNGMLKDLGKEQDDVEALAKIHAAYDIYKGEMLKKGAIETMGTAETPAIKRESLRDQDDGEC